MTDEEKVVGIMARRIEEKLNGLEVAAANLMQNIAYARSELIRKADGYEELKNVVKLLIATLNDTTWDEGHPGYADNASGYRCPNCSCKDCYRISCKYNESELFKKIYKEFPELYENI